MKGGKCQFQQCDGEVMTGKTREYDSYFFNRPQSTTTLGASTTGCMYVETHWHTMSTTSTSISTTMDYITHEQSNCNLIFPACHVSLLVDMFDIYACRVFWKL